MYDKWLHRFAFFTAINTFILIFIGGLVTSTGSGLSVPDWPTTYGENMFTFPMDKWIGGIKYEHGHRLFASYVGFLTIILAIWIAAKDDRRWLKITAFSALSLVIIQGILGGLTVLYLLPTPISVAHGMMAQSFLCLVASIALFTSRWWRQSVPITFDQSDRKYIFVIFISSIVVFIQLLFGALLRHTYSGLAVPDFPFSYGHLFPPLDLNSVAEYNRQLIQEKIKWTGDRPIEAYQIVIHLIHRFWAYMVSVVLILSGYIVYKNAKIPSPIRRNGIMLIIAIIVQFSLGALTVLTRKEIVITTAHVATGAATLVLCVLTTLQLLRLYGFLQNKDNS